jgi:threonyl-tRNA synthetase
VPDVHIWTAPEDTGTRYLQVLALAAEGTDFWFGRDYLHILDSVAGTAHDDDGFYRDAARAAGGVTIVRRRPEQSKYYSQKTAIVIYSGYDNVMLYNIQLDETNPRRFGITTDAGQFPTVIHACVAMAGSRLLPLILGRGLAGVAPQVIPPELATTQVVFVPVRAEHTDRARTLAESLPAAGVRTAVNTDFQRSFGARLSRLRREWQPLYSVVGDRELDTAPALESAGRTVADDVVVHVSAQAARWARCRPHSPLGTAPPPIVGEN